jgi:lambda family phage portal protein
MMGHMLSNLNSLFKSATVDSNDAWTAIPLPPDQFITLRQPALVARSREQWSNNDYVRGYIRMCRQNIVGEHGVKLQVKATLSNGKLDKVANAAIEAAFAEWCKRGNCDVTGQLSWRGIQALCVEHAARDGEFIIRKVRGADAGPFGYALQVIDPQRLPVRYQDYKSLTSGNFIRNGIEFNRYGRPIAFHFASTDESDSQFYYSISGEGYIRIPAEEIIHGFVTEMASQKRGIPWSSTSLFRLHHLQGFEDASVQNARATASKMGIVEWTEGYGPTWEEGDDSPLETFDAEPLSFHELPQGAKLAEWNPQYPAGEFEVAHKVFLRGAATGMGVSYNALGNNLENVNFSSIRDGKVSERDFWKELQGWLIETLIQPVYEDWLKIALLSEKIVNKQGKPLPPSKLAIYKTVHYQGRRWAWIDPKSDATAKTTEIRAGLTSISQVLREQGRDPEAVAAEIASDIEMLKEAGVPQEFISVMFGILPAPEAAPSKADESVAKAPAAGK